MNRPKYDLLVLAIAMGLGYGFIEAAEVMALYAVPGALSWMTGNTPNILWTAPLVYGIAFGALALPFVLLAQGLPRVDWATALVALLFAISAFLAASLQGSLASDLTSAIFAAGVAAEGTRQFRKHREKLRLLSTRSIPFLIVATAFMAAATTAGSYWLERRSLASLTAAPANSANVILMVMDTQRADHLSLYGYERRTSPRLDSLAKEATVFENASANSSWTLPTHATMFTGLLPFEHGAGTMGHSRLDGRYPTIAETLLSRGYATGGFIANTFWTARHTGLNRGFIRYRDHYGSVAEGITRTALGRRIAYDVLPSLGFVDVPGRKTAGDVNRELLSWLDDIGDRPFFAFLNYFDVHSPLLPPEPYAGMFSGLSAAEIRKHAIAIKDLDGTHAPPPPDELRRMVDSYDESIRYLDTEIGNLLDSLRRRNKLDNTLLIVTSDHGESWGEHGLIFHGQSLYRELTRVPLIVRQPGGRQSSRSRAAVGLDQIPATIAAFAGLDTTMFPGVSLFADSARQRPTVLQLPRRSTKVAAQPASRSSLVGLATERWQYIESSSGAELFDLFRDPHGLRDASVDPGISDTALALGQRLRAIPRAMSGVQ